MQKKIIYIILDGGGDRPIPDFNYQTPLEAANTPNMDWFADHGQSGLLYTLKKGVVPGSDTAHLALFGYDPYEPGIYSGRGPVEAAGINMEVLPGDIAFRVNMATFNEGVVVDRRAGRISSGTDTIAEVINEKTFEDIKVFFKEGTAHRGALILRGPGLSDKVTTNDPKYDNHPPKPFKAIEPQGEKTARILTALVNDLHPLLNDLPVNKKRVQAGQLPANYLLIRGAGKASNLPKFPELYSLKAACVAGGGLYKGVARLIGMDVFDYEWATGDKNSDYNRKAEKTVELLKEYDFIFLHVKSTDNAGHDGDFKLKKALFERVDEAFGQFKGLKDTVIVITSDHSTPCITKNHSSEPCALVIYSDGGRRDKVVKFSELSAASGSLGVLHALELIPVTLGKADRSEKFGA